MTDAGDAEPPGGAEGPSGDAAAGAGRWSWVWKVAVAVAVVAVLMVAGRQALTWFEDLSLWVEDKGAWGAVVFGAAYAVATVAFVPGSAVTLAGGAVFGLWVGALTVWIGAMIGSCAAFLIGRHVARDWVAARTKDSPRFQAIDRAVRREGLKVVLLLRLSPVFPFNLLNYALGLTAVRFRDYAIAGVGMIPGTFMYVYIGTLIGSVAQAFGGGERERTTGEWVLLGVGLVATIAVTVVITRTAKRALAERTDLDEEDVGLQAE